MDVGGVVLLTPGGGGGDPGAGRDLAARRVRKEYVARVAGRFPDGDVVCRVALAPHPATGTVMGVRDGAGKACETHFCRTAYDPLTHTSLVTATPRTGRTHQIRAHLRHLGHPVANDARYLRSPDARSAARGADGGAAPLRLGDVVGGGRLAAAGAALDCTVCDAVAPAPARGWAPAGGGCGAPARFGCGRPPTRRRGGVALCRPAAAVGAVRGGGGGGAPAAAAARRCRAGGTGQARADEHPGARGGCRSGRASSHPVRAPPGCPPPSRPCHHCSLATAAPRPATGTRWPLVPPQLRPTLPAPRTRRPRGATPLSVPRRWGSATGSGGVGRFPPSACRRSWGGRRGSCASVGGVCQSRARYPPALPLAPCAGGRGGTVGLDGGGAGADGGADARMREAAWIGGVERRWWPSPPPLHLICAPLALPCSDAAPAARGRRGSAGCPPRPPALGRRKRRRRGRGMHCTKGAVVPHPGGADVPGSAPRGAAPAAPPPLRVPSPVADPPGRPRPAFVPRRLWPPPPPRAPRSAAGAGGDRKCARGGGRCCPRVRASRGLCARGAAAAAALDRPASPLPRPLADVGAGRL
ncbi:hypothetical protein BU14_0328s0017 [Porphyra umbilicalis]|uniref:Pseudouridine synthase RsuA/RluA-like domain-containing protein n=1 Tax=Porphyra umbilicalis TaxID=2786 RepID=A0A1X6NYZ9_PORUM|nr:hypothetical protein BU14_0328s0017 [Porphyra umbilicalis]|eukprot:OSX73765.1 hypothetical protein BU14_0328s0017 [Porphyra umbilicalis]